MITIDRKFIILAVNPCKRGTKLLKAAILFLQAVAKVFRLNVCTQAEGFYFKAADIYAVDALRAYVEAMKKGEAGKVDQEQIHSAELLIQRVFDYRYVKGTHLPDITGDCGL